MRALVEINCIYESNSVCSNYWWMVSGQAIEHHLYSRA